MRVAEDRCHVRSREWRRETCSGKSEGCAVTQLPAESGTSVMVSPPPRVMPVEDGVGAGQDEACRAQREPSWMNSRREGCRGAHRLVSETLRREGDNLQKINQNQCSTEALKLSSGRGLKFPSGSFCHEAVTGLREAGFGLEALRWMWWPQAGRGQEPGHFVRERWGREGTSLSGALRPSPCPSDKVFSSWRLSSEQQGGSWPLGSPLVPRNVLQKKQRCGSSLFWELLPRLATSSSY